MKLMITNGGPHPADKHAATTAESVLDLIEIAESSETPELAAEAREARMAKLELMPVLTVLLTPHFETATGDEDAALAAKNGMKRLNTPNDPTSHIDATIDTVLDTIKSYPVFAKHFAGNALAEAAIRQILGVRFATAIDVQRCWHADKDLDHPESIAFWAAKETEQEAPTA